MRTLFIVPKMFTAGELSRVDIRIPDDYTQKSKEFWEYVDQKLKTQRSVQKLYYDSLTTDDSDKALEFVKKNNEHCLALVQKFIEGGAKLELSEDRLLLEETASWISMLRGDPEQDLATQELLAKNMMDRDKFLADKISESLTEGETGILFLSAGREVANRLPSDLRVIKIQPFDPSDYLNSWLATMALKKTQVTDTPA